ncbi:MAG: hypothetical protein M1821_009625 [Bathelium mastoideum]|nr:MAG: hypothetical protein M1821_009625 [Bathelium mastoideum]KAI9688851.1 MAG: hypothetical protein M1822_001208 [Bathelium mastoideum]
MLQKVAIACGALAVLLLYRILSIVITSRRHAARARNLGCQPPPKHLKDDYLGIHGLRELSTAHADRRVPDQLFNRYKGMTLSEGRQVDTFATKTLFRSNIFTVDPKNIQAVLATQFQDFGLGQLRRENFFPLLGNGIFTTDGPGWEHSRAMLRPNFVRDQVADLVMEERHVQNLMQALPVNAEGWTEELDIQTLFFRITIDTATEFLFGESVDSQLANLPEGVPAKCTKKGFQEESVFAPAFDHSQKWISYRSRYGQFFWLVNPKDFQESNKQCHAFVDHFVQKALNHTAKDSDALEKGEKEDRYVFLEALARQTRDPIEIRSQLLNILLAGRDTTASLLSWLFHFLIRHPAVLQRLRAEIRASLGTYANPHDLTFAGLKNCAYLQWCLHETLRLYPVVPINSRTALRDTTLPRGGGPDGSAPVYIRKGQPVVYSVHVLHRREDIWGADYDEFKPERWQGRRAGWDYLPFNGGPRICLGQQLALTEAGYVTVRLLQRFEDVQMGNKEVVGESPRQNLTLTSCPNDGVWLRFKEAAKE